MDDFSVPSALLGQAALLLLLVVILWAFMREAARWIVRGLVGLGVAVGVAVLLGWMDETAAGALFERVGEWLLTGVEVVARRIAGIWRDLASGS